MKKMVTAGHAIRLAYWLCCLCLPVFGAMADEVVESPEWLRATQLKQQMDTAPQALSTADLARFRALYDENRRRHDVLWGRGVAIVDDLTSQRRDADAREAERLRFNASCSQVATPAELSRCQSWADRLNSWADRLNANQERLDQTVNRHNAEARSWAEDVEARFNRPLEQALAPKAQHWTFTSKDLAGKDQVADVTIDEKGQITGHGWKTRVPGCVPDFYPLDITGNFSAGTFSFSVSGSGCGKKSVISGTGTGTLLNAAHARGRILGTIWDPLTPNGRDFDTEWNGVRR